MSDGSVQMRRSGGPREEEGEEELGRSLRDWENLQADHQTTAEYLEGLHTWQETVVNTPLSLVHITVCMSACTLRSPAKQDNTASNRG